MGNLEVSYAEGDKWYKTHIVLLDNVKAIRFPDGTIYDFILEEKGKNPWKVDILKDLPDCNCTCVEECDRKIVLSRLTKVKEDL